MEKSSIRIVTGIAMCPVATIRQLSAALRKDGFSRSYRCRCGGATVAEFAKRIDDRGLIVQLWSDGCHRVSHGSYSKINGHDCLYQTTMPTDFKSLDGMINAIKFETIRPSTIPPTR